MGLTRSELLKMVKSDWNNPLKSMILTDLGVSIVFKQRKCSVDTV